MDGPLLQMFLELWCAIPMLLKRIIVAAPLVIGVVASVVVWEWIPAAAGAAVSIILFCLPGPSDSEKNGYNF